MKLEELIGPATKASYVNRVYAALAALPQEIRFAARQSSKPQIFESIADASAFLQTPQFDFDEPVESYAYEITYSDGSEFSREVETLAELRELHREIERLAEHVNFLQP